MADRPAPTSSIAAWSLAALVAGYLLVELVGGATASPLVPVLPRGVRVPTWTARGARIIGLDRVGRGTLTVLALILVALLVCAFVLLVREAWRGRVRLAPILVAGGLSLALSVAGPLILSRDVYSYAAYGRMFAIRHANPYSTPPSTFPGDPFTPVLSPEWVSTRSVYGPAFVLASAGVSRLSEDSPAATIRAFKVLSGLAVGGAALLAVWACRRVRPGRAGMAGALVALNPVLVIHTVGGGHSDALAAVLLAGALWFSTWPVEGFGAPGGRAPGGALKIPPLAVTVLLTLAALIKLPVAVALVVWLWVVLRRRGREGWPVVGAAHAGLVVGVVAAVSAPLWIGWRTLSSLGTLASVEGWASGLRLVARGAEGLARAVSGPSAAGTADHVTRAVFYVVFAAALWWVLRRARPASIGNAWGASLLLLALALPYLLPWYVAWFVVFLPLLSDDLLLWVGVSVSALLALTGIPAEPDGAPGLWRDMVLVVHYGVAPIMLGLLVVAVARVFTRTEPAPVEAPPEAASVPVGNRTTGPT